MTKIELGDKVKDSVTGFTGIAVCQTLWINGCTRIGVQPIGVNKEGKSYDMETFDEPLLIVLKRKAKKEGRHDTGGPRPSAVPMKKSEY